MGYVSGDPRDRVPKRLRPYYDCLVRICRMEIEVYGQVMSLSAEWWLRDHGKIINPKPPPPNPGLGVAKECLRKCRNRDLESISGDGTVLYLYCPKHGTRRDPVPPPPPPIGGLIMPTRPNPTRGERR